jgi:hypothetical protein
VSEAVFLAGYVFLCGIGFMFGYLIGDITKLLHDDRKIRPKAKSASERGV